MLGLILSLFIGRKKAEKAAGITTFQLFERWREVARALEGLANSPKDEKEFMRNIDELEECMAEIDRRYAAVTRHVLLLITADATLQAKSRVEDDLVSDFRVALRRVAQASESSVYHPCFLWRELEQAFEGMLEFHQTAARGRL